ncbi:hypothetical protein FKP32DRAFT_1055739 [Trametes sanguinea]|nr:hypothetical protein FKP32DRAFT_1055739 [Trametes sanguinea]
MVSARLEWNVSDMIACRLSTYISCSIPGCQCQDLKLSSVGCAYAAHHHTTPCLADPLHRSPCCCSLMEEHNRGEYPLPCLQDPYEQPSARPASCFSMVAAPPCRWVCTAFAFFNPSPGGLSKLFPLHRGPSSNKTLPRTRSRPSMTGLAVRRLAAVCLLDSPWELRPCRVPMTRLKMLLFRHTFSHGPAFSALWRLTSELLPAHTV